MSAESLETDLKILKATVATKEDLARSIADVRVEMHKEFTSQTTRIIGWMIGAVGLAVAALKYLP